MAAAVRGVARSRLACSGARTCLWLLALLLAASASADIAAAPKAAEGEPISVLPEPAPADERRVRLGEQLFADRRLSGDLTRSCSSCHDVRLNGASGRRRDLALDGQELPFNTLTVFNAALNFRLNWAGGLRSLEQQAESLLQSPTIMGASIPLALERLAADAAMVRAFEEAYGRGPDRESLLNAIATYERSLLTPGSRFDRWLGGEGEALSAGEQAGYALFKSVGCVACHQGVNVGGNLFQRRGIFRPLSPDGPPVLRVPSLRNVAATPPYFHDGSAATLEEAVRRMGLAQLNRRLSAEEIGGITAFLRALTGTYQGAAVTAAPP
jgi:cytochrome c peroxidase